MNNDIVLKQDVEDYIKYKEYFDSHIDKDFDVLVEIAIDNTPIISKYRLEYPNAKMYVFEHERSLETCECMNVTSYNIDTKGFFDKPKTTGKRKSSKKNQTSKFEKAMNLIKKENPGKKIQVIMNPPFKIGGDVWDQCRKITHNIVCIGPLRMYKKGNRCQWVDKITLIDPKLFKDASITDNLSITTCRDTLNKNQTYLNLETKTYKQEYMDYFNINLKLDKTILKYSHAGYRKINEKLNRDVVLAWNRRTAAGSMITSDSEFMRWNDKSDNMIDSDIFIENTRPNQWRADIIWFKNSNQRCNFWIWCKNGKLSNNLLNALNKNDGSIENIFPRIDWESISEHPLWKKGDYDSAVLDVMGLKWNEDKTGVVVK